MKGTKKQNKSKLVNHYSDFSWISVLSVNLTGAKRGTRVHFDTITISLLKDPPFSVRVEWAYKIATEGDLLTASARG